MDFIEDPPGRTGARGGAARSASAFGTHAQCRRHLGRLQKKRHAFRYMGQRRWTRRDPVGDPESLRVHRLKKKEPYGRNLSKRASYYEGYEQHGEVDKQRCG